MKSWMARPIRGLNMYDERKTKTRDDSEATSYGIYLYGEEKARCGYASDEVYSLLILGLLWATIVCHATMIPCYRWQS